ncbi:MAG: extensin family protein [Amylibacter sp.]
MIKTCAGLVVFLVLATAAQASFAPFSSPIPKLRKGHSVIAFVPANGLKTSPVPDLRNSQLQAVVRSHNQEIATLVQIAEHERQKEIFQQAASKSERPSGSLISLERSLVPRVRPSHILSTEIGRRTVARAETPKTTNKTKRLLKSRKGSVCGVKSIKGTSIPRISGRGACGIANPVKLTEVAGIPLTRELTVNCKTAKKFDKWVSKSVKPTIGRKGGGLASVQIIGGYSCRTRNSKRGAKLSEHSKGNAIDIAGFKLSDGTIYSVKRGWRSGSGRRTLRKLHKSACGPFGTVLGPNADRHHQDHFHIDIGRHRSGSYCR